MGAVAEARNHLSRVAFARRIFPDLLPWQEQLLRSNATRVLIAAARQSGKSSTCAMIALHQILYREGSLVLVVSRSVRQSGELTKKIKAYYHHLGEPVKAEAEQQLSLTLKNHSRLVTLPGDEATIRAFSSVDLLIIDEAARVPDEVYAAVSPMLGKSGGRMIALSTPAGQQNKFADWWARGDFERHIATCYDLPEGWYKPSNEEFLAKERSHMTAEEFAREYEVSFTEADFQLFTRELLEGAIDESVEPLPELEAMAWRHLEER